MKKLLSLALLALVGVALPLTAAEPAAFVPDKTPLLCHINGVRASAVPWVKEALGKDPDMAAKLKQSDAIYAKFGLTEKDVCSGSAYVVLTQSEDVAIFLKTNVPEAKFVPLVKAFLAADEKGKDVIMDEKLVVGRKFYVFCEKDEKGGKGDEVFAATYLAPDVVALMETEDAEKVLSAPAGKNPLLGKVDRAQLLSLVYDPAMAKKQEEAPEVTGADLGIDLTGKAQKDLTIVSNLSFPNEQKAMETAQQLQMMLPMFTGMVFGKDPDLAGDVMKGLKVTTPGKTKLNIRFALSEKTIDAITAYLEKPENLPDFGQKSVGGAEQDPGQGAKPAAK